MSFLAILAAVPWGTFLGGVMSGAVSWFKSREEREMLKLQHSHQVDLLKLQAAGAINLAEWEGFKASHASAAAEDGSGVWRWVKSLRYGTRSMLTWVLVLAAVFMAWRAGSGSDLPARIVFFAEMALGWHFGWKATGAKK